MYRRSRRRVLQGALVLAVSSLLSGCDKPARIFRIGFLAAGTREGRGPFIEALSQGLRALGYVEGRNIVIEYRFSGDRYDRLPELAGELVALKVDLIVASGSPASSAARDATTAIPIVMGSLSADPVVTGLIASLARPGGNITGLTSIAQDLSAKWLQLLKETLPTLSRVAVFWNRVNPAYGPILKDLEPAAQTAGVQVQRLEVQVPEDFENAVLTARQHGAEALIAPGDPLVNNRPRMLADLALKHRLPTIGGNLRMVATGGLLSFGPDIVDQYRRSASYVDRILKGAKPADLPVEQPTKFDLGVNLKTAHTLGLAIPQSILKRATHVIR